MSTVSAVNETRLHWEALGRTIAEKRRAVGMTQLQLAEAIGRDQSDISKIERGQTQPLIDTVFRISATIGTPPMRLFRILEKGE